MALIKQNASIPFVQGIDQKTDEKQLTDGKLLAVENGVFSKFGVINKRHGFDSLSTTVLNGTALTSASNITSFKDELVLFGANKVYSYSDTNDKWIDKGQSISVATKQMPVFTNNYSQAIPDSAHLNGFTIYAWEDSRGGVRGTIIDEDTGTIVLPESSFSTSGSCPRVAAIQQYLYVFYQFNNEIRWKRVSTEDPTTISVMTSIATDSSTTPMFNVITYGTAMLLTYRNTSNNIVLSWLTREGLIATPIQGFPAKKTIIETVSNALNITAFSGTSGEYIGLCWQNSSTGIKTAIYNRNFVQVVAPTVLDATTTQVSAITGSQGAYSPTQLTVDGDTFRWYYTIKDAVSTKTTIRTNAIKVDGTKNTSAVFKRSVGLVGEAFIQGNVVYIPTLHDSTYQSTVFVMNSLGYISSKFFDPATSFAAGSLPAKPFLCKTYSPADNVHCFAAPVKERLITADNTAFTLQNIRKCEMDYSGDTSYNSAQIGNSLYLSGGIIYSYDGVGTKELGFHLFPEGTTVADTTKVGTAGLPNGTYQYAVLYSWLDNKGELQRSATSIPITYTNSSGTSKRVVLTIPTLRLTEKTSVQVEVYRTEANGEIFYRVFDYGSVYVYNDPTVDTITFNDETADSALISQEILYTVGGILDNDAPTSASIILAHQNRVFLAGTQTTDKVYYSKKYVPGQSVNFSAYQILQVNPNGGIITALGSLDDKLIIFKRDNIYGVFGDGPLPTGENNTFSEPQLVASDVGCSNINSVAYTPMGLVFMSKKGIYLLNKSLQTEYIGAPVEDYNDADITSSQIVEDVNEVRFTTSTGTTLVYNYFFQQWTTFTNQEGIASTTWKNRYLYVDAEGNVFKENREIFYDDGASYSLKLVTGWLKQFSGLQGFQRVYRASIIGSYKSEHRLRVKVYYDYESYPSQVIYFNPASSIGGDADATYGDISPYGLDGSVYGGGLSNVYQFRMHLKKQQCTALKFEIEDIPDNDNISSTGESYAIANLTMEIGVKGGISRLPRGKSL